MGGLMGFFEGYKDGLAMVGLQCIYAGFALFSRAAFLDGLNPQIYIVYRQAIATLLIAPPALLNRRREGLSLCLNLKTFSLIFAAAFFGITANQTAYYEGIYFASATIASALVNLTTAVTFLMAVVVRLEKVNLLSIRGAAKIMGTLICVAGAAAVSLLKGPTLINVSMNLSLTRSVSALGVDSWLLGCLLVFASCWCWSAWLILQVPVSRNCPDHLYSTFLTCLFGLIQSTVLALCMERKIEDWSLNTTIEIVACVFSGIGSAVAFFGQAWCVSRKGPVFSAMFNPLCTVVVAIMACLFLQEDIYLGSLIGAVAIIAGLYMVLWGKAKDQAYEQTDPSKMSSSHDLQESLLPHRTSNGVESSPDLIP